ncbi:MAG TPA: hypothetical protein VGF85_11910, partial [Opitutaceae bacterium]
GRVILAVSSTYEAVVLAAAQAAGVPADALGSTTYDGALAIATDRGPLRWSVAELRAGWETSIGVAMKRPGIS